MPWHGGGGAARGEAVRVDLTAAGPVWHGVGALTAGASSRQLLDYPEPARSELLDLLFSEQGGAAFQLLKAEIGGDSFSGYGSAPSVYHTPSDVSYERGVDLWILREAKRRNPRLTTACLAWAAPNWVGEFESRLGRNWHTAYIRGVQNAFDITFDYAGIRSERRWDPDYIVRFRRSLDRAGLSGTGIVAADQADGGLGILDSMEASADLAAAVSVVGLHPSGPLGAEVGRRVRALGKPLWASEVPAADGPAWPDGKHGQALRWLRQVLANYQTAGCTATIVSPAIHGSSQNLVWQSDRGAAYANDPWSGHYELSAAFWAQAHLTQFTRRGWRSVTVQAGGAGALQYADLQYAIFVGPSGPEVVTAISTIPGNECPDGASKITNQAECWAAMDQVGPSGLSWGGTEIDEDWPSGCYLCQDVDGCVDGTWFNSHPTGGTRGTRRRRRNRGPRPYCKAETTRHFLENGCSTNPSEELNTTRYGHPRFAADTESVGEVVCCEADSLVQGGVESHRHINGRCISGSNDAAMRTYREAVDLCEAEGMRLCRGPEELDLSCGSGCQYDNALIWTSREIGVQNGFTIVAVNAGEVTSSLQLVLSGLPSPMPELHLWRTTASNWFTRNGTVLAATGGELRLDLPGRSIATVSTVATATHYAPAVPPRTGFPLPWHATFNDQVDFHPARFFNDVYGAFEIHSMFGGSGRRRNNKVVRQSVERLPDAWIREQSPFTLMPGGTNWMNYEVAVSVSFGELPLDDEDRPALFRSSAADLANAPGGGYLRLCGRVPAWPLPMPNISLPNVTERDSPPNGLCLTLLLDGNWTFEELNSTAAERRTLGRGTVTRQLWHKLGLRFDGDAAVATVDGAVVFASTSLNGGVAGFGCGRHYAYFDDFSLAPTRERFPGSFVLDLSPGQRLRNDFAGWVGTILDLSQETAGCELLALGRYATLGNSRNHNMTVFRSSDGERLVLPGAAEVAMATCVPDINGFCYSQILSEPLVLAPGEVYYVVSEERRLGDEWLEMMDAATIVDSGHGFGPALLTHRRPGYGQITGSVFSRDGANWSTSPGLDMMAGPVNWILGGSASGPLPGTAAADREHDIGLWEAGVGGAGAGGTGARERGASVPTANIVGGHGPSLFPLAAFTTVLFFAVRHWRRRSNAVLTRPYHHGPYDEEGEALVDSVQASW